MSDPAATRLPMDAWRALRTAGAALERAGIRDEPVLVAVSGGGDSMALLEIAGLLAPKLGLALHVACVDHALRPASTGEVALVREAAARWSTTFHEVRLAPDRSDEDTLRRARHAALERVRRAAGCRVLLLGHTRDDQIETIVFRFLRGAGLGGLAGMEPIRPTAGATTAGVSDSTATGVSSAADATIASAAGGVLVRPLLGVERAALRSLLVARGVAWAEDPTNESPRYARGRLRRDVLPAVGSAFGQGALEHLIDVAPRWRADEDFLEREAARCLAFATRRSGGVVRLDADALAGLHPAMRARVLRQWIAEATGRSPTSREIAGIESWLGRSTAPDGRLDLPGARLERAAGCLALVAAAPPHGRDAGDDRPRKADAGDGDESAPRVVCPDVDTVRCSPKGVLPPSEARVRVPRHREFSQEIPQRCRDSAATGRGRGRRGVKGLTPNE